ncbi:vitamin K epoxide reductase family protein [Flagellimonas sp.]|uniref:vitamin K epoxide reductase family protein n=1 Tax=Flagellimonas sp. TaxID=2058762 RepID=UPI003B5C3A69
MDNCVSTTKYLLPQLNIKYTRQFLEDNILSHPEHPSLLCVSDTLEKYKIDNLAVKIGTEKLKEIPLPCIVQLSDQGGMFHVLKQYSDDKVVYLDEKGKSVALPTKDFLSRWTGICLLVESNEQSKEPGIEKSIDEKRMSDIFKWAIIVLLLLWAGTNISDFTLFNNEDSQYFVGYTLLKLIGLITGVMLLWYEVDKYNPTLQSFCSGGKKVNCEVVLNSKYSKVFNGQFSLGLIGFAYFFGTLFFLLFNGFSNTSLTLLAYLSFATLPVVAVSLYYQGLIIKQWCKFCIIVQAVLLMEITLVYFGNFYQGSIEPDSLLLLAALLLVPIPTWKWFKPLLEGKKEKNLYKRGLKKIKNNPNVLSGLLAKSRKIEKSTEGLGISFISKTARFNVVKVCNPYCGPCAKAHPILEELMEAGKINLQILFTASAEENNIKAKAVAHFLAIEAQGNKEQTQMALDDWYLADNKDYEVFSKKHPMNGELKEQYKKIEAMRRWCDVEKITHTPTIFINGHELPKEYSVEDLKEVLN